MRLIDLLEEKDIVLNAPISSKKRLFEEIARKLGNKDSEQRAIYDSLIQREKRGNTSLGNGVAIPHGQSLAGNQTRVALFRLKKGIDYEAPDNLDVDLVIAAAFPQQADAEHEKILQDAARMLRNHRTYRQLKASDNAEGVLNILAQST